MNTNHIRYILSSDPSTSSTFRGVMARDEFVKCRVTCPSIFVCNTDNADQAGTHWIAIFVSKLGKCEYFDSYGLPPLFEDLTSKLLSIDKKFIYNDTVLQSNNTNVCGIYSIVFLQLKCRGYSLSRILDLLMYANNSEERDHILKYYLDTKYANITNLGQIPPIHQVSGIIDQQCVFKSNDL